MSINQMCQADVRCLMEVAVEHASEPILITDADLEESGPTICFVNEAFTELSGYSEEELLGETPRLLQGPETDKDVIEDLGESLRNGEPWGGKTINYRKDGTPYWVSWRVAPVTVEGEIKYWISFQRDVTDEAHMEAELARMAMADPLTEVPNRNAFFAKANAFIEAGKTPFAVGLLDLDGFKQVNDSHGHRAGDEVLKILSDRIKGQLRAGDLLSRLGGDEFAFLLQVANLESLKAIFDRIFESIEKPIRRRDYAAELTASVGVAFLPDEQDNIGDALDLADQRMYEVKGEAGSNLKAS